ncbi:MAG: hypothetical protein MZU97_14710 [Bacillus subtilis]|nr:hypothetical protein [Bacillus subtilis]
MAGLHHDIGKIAIPDVDPEQDRQADAGGVRNHEEAHGGRIPDPPRRRRILGTRRVRALAPGAMGRQGVSARTARHRHPALLAHHQRR